MRSLKEVVAMATTALSVAAWPLTGTASATTDNGTAMHVNLATVKGVAMAWADLRRQGDRTWVVIALSDVPPEPVDPSLIAEIYEGTCGSLSRAPVRAVENTLAGYLPAPYYVGGLLKISLETLLHDPHAIVVKTGPEAGGVELACGNIE